MARFNERLEVFEAALPVCRAEPKKKAVHTLRSAIRSLEAALSLFAALKGMPDAHTERDDFLATTHDLRGLAGKVRDLDVFQKLLEDHEAEIAIDADDIRKTREQCRKLRQACKQRRKTAAKRLVEAVEEQETTLAAAAEALRAAYKAQQERPIAAADLLRVANHQFQAHRELKLVTPDDDELHTIRKAAKQARMQLELAGDDPEVAPFTERYHQLQQAGGDWHDWLALTGFAEKVLGEHKATTRALAARRDRCLRAFEDQLAAFRPAKKPAAKAA